MNDKVLEALNAQIAHELYASHLYLAMCAYFEHQNLPGFAAWMRKQSDEERAHALRIFEHVTDRGGRVTLRQVDAPEMEFDSPAGVFRAALEHERKVTGLINDLFRQARETQDYATEVMLQWFIEEQVEEEKSASEVVDLLDRLGGETAALLMLDRRLGARTD